MTDAPIVWGIDAEASGFAISTSDGHDAEWRDAKGVFTIFKLTAMLRYLSISISDWPKPVGVWIEYPTGGVTERWKHRALRPTFTVAGAMAGKFVDPFGDYRIPAEFVDYWTWHRALCKGVPIPADILAAFPTWADHDLATVAALKLRGVTMPVNASTHQVDARAIVAWGEDQWRAEQQGQPQTRRKGGA